MKRLLKSLSVLIALAAGLFLVPSVTRAADCPSPGKVYELRTYIANPGKLDAMLARFRDHTCRLFKKHNIEVIGFWTPADGDASQDTLIYLVAFPSVEAQQAAWTAFLADPEWVKVKADSEKDGKLAKEIQSKNLKPTDFSPLR